MSIKQTTDFISIGCNPLTHTAVWGPPPHSAGGSPARSIVAYGANNYVALYDPLDDRQRGVWKTLRGHTGRVNCVKNLTTLGASNSSRYTSAVVSGSADTTVRIWKPLADGQWGCSAVLKGHTCPVVSLATLAGVPNANGEALPPYDLIASGATDGTVRVYRRTEGEGTAEDEVKCIQTLNCGTKYPLALAWALLPNSAVPILATGNTDSKVHLYVPDQSGKDSVEANDEICPFTWIHSLALAGHDGWVRCLDWAGFSEPDPADPTRSVDYLLLASGSQDKYIRLWKVAPYQIALTSNATNDEAPSTEAMLQSLQESFGRSAKVASSDGPTQSIQLTTKSQLMAFTPYSDSPLHRWTVSIDAVILGHDDWVHSVQWHPAQWTDGRWEQPTRFVSSSADKSMIIWSPDSSTGIWISESRVGEMGGMSLGFCDGTFSPDGQYLLAHSASGSFHLWRRPSHSDTEASTSMWEPRIAISGHTKAVQDVSWDPHGLFVVSVSLDQSARLFAPWTRPAASSDDQTLSTWHEVARPQIHGYDLQCLAFTGNYQYVSGADEKVLRVFDATGMFVESLAAISNRPELRQDTATRPLGANLPALGLSNKAVFEADLQTVEAQEEDFLARQYTTMGRGTGDTLRQAPQSPPLEDYLKQYTLWPETGKVYGHGYELIAVAASHDGTVVASCCRATSEKHAVIRLVDTQQWLEYTAPLAGHSLTITRIQFSHSDQWILSVSRDRSWTLHRRQPENPTSTLPEYQLVHTQSKAHTRIIWDASWSHDDTVFATGSRDKCVKLWTMAPEAEGTTPPQLLTTIKFEDSVTAVAFAPALIGGRYYLSVGLENGLVYLVRSSPGEESGAKQPLEWLTVGHLDPLESAGAFISRLDWRPSPSKEQSPSAVGYSYQLACASHDFSVRLFTLDLS
ncbi:Elongator subunit elp2 [Dispira parvispora]|uniref:Elongator complex protein 2 n=1 Tax=Dispira parvispora TaxID=1520584 RepID=A0A9W8AMP0_9FUNG|nr:Elongator subunit elp2 [Dispira parvispora]